MRENHKYKTCGICSVLLIAMLSSATVADEPVISLFDGKTLDGWVTLDDQPITKGWEVVDGTIHVKVEKERSGHIKTTRTFENFELEFEWRIAQGGNSGVKYLAKESDSDRGRAYYGCEFQILDDKRHKNGRTPRKTAGALYDLYAPVADQKHLKPLGDFNHSKVVVDNGRIEHWLNGKKIVEATIGSKDWQAKVGKSKVSSVKDFANGPGVILLQEHLSEAWFKNIQIKPLPKTANRSAQKDFEHASTDKRARILTCADDMSPVILEVARKADFPDFKTFRDTVQALPFQFDGTILTYTGLSKDRFKFFQWHTHRSRTGESLRQPLRAIRLGQRDYHDSKRRPKSHSELQ